MNKIKVISFEETKKRFYKRLSKEFRALSDDLVDDSIGFGKDEDFERKY